MIYIDDIFGLQTNLTTADVG